MDIKAAIEMLLNKINTRSQMAGGGGSASNIQMLQRDVNQAISTWQESHDTSGLIQITATLHVYSRLTDSEYEQIMDILNGDN